MNKMAKGAIATGVGVILLVGGGGTLATWNQAQNATMGSVVSGDLNLVATNAKWTNAAGTTVDIASYKVVPGDVLTYTQDVNVTLSGDLMTAKLAVTGAGVDGTGATAFGDAAVVNPTTLTKDGKSLPDVLTTANNPGTVTASTTFTFKGTSTTGRTAVKASYNLGGVGYSLVQQAPASSNTL